MKKLISAICIVALSSATIGVATAPAMAQVQSHTRAPTFESHGDYAYYNGHRGYRTFHQGYRYYNGYWFPVAAFVIGGIIGSIFFNALANAHR